MSERNPKTPRRSKVEPSVFAEDPLLTSGIPRLYDSGSETTETQLYPFLAASAPARETLTVLEGKDAERVYSLDGKTTWIGRDDDCRVCLRDRGVSRRHASIAPVGRSFVLRDNGAKNGTYVNGRRVVEHALQPGDEIQLGPSVSLLFSLASGAEERLAQQQAARHELVKRQMYADRIESLAQMVAGLAHEINTPLGVANTANALIVSLVDEVSRTEPGPALDAALVELKASADLMTRNLARASQLVQSFKQLSARQLGGEYLQCDLGGVVEDCFAAMSAETTRRNVSLTTNWTDGDEFPWTGYPGHLSQVLLSLLQNTMRYAYKEDEEGKVDVNLIKIRDTYCLEFKDYGAGVPLEVLPRIFEPFVTSGREAGSAGLGLAIVYNIVTNILGGGISCSSVAGKGTVFLLEIPRCCPPQEGSSTTTGPIIPAPRAEPSK